MKDTGTVQHPFDIAVSLEKIGKGSFIGHTSDLYWNMVGPFGGVTAAVMLRSVLENPECRGDPVVLHMHFCAPLAKGAFEVSSAAERTSKSTQHWAIRLTQSGGVASYGSAMCAARPETFESLRCRAPSAPPFEDLPRYQPRGFAWVDQFDFRFSEGEIELSDSDETPGRTRSVLRVGHLPERQLDFPGLAALCDIFFGRIVHLRRRLVPFGTVTMTASFHVTAEELARQKPGPILGLVDSNIFRKGFHDQYAEIWTEDGKLLATTSQVVYFRD